MKLHYFAAAPNFGDALNPWLWPQLLGSRLDADASRLFLGIGSILNTALPVAQEYYVLGTGCGYGRHAVIDSRWKIYAVRGPRTAHTLGLPPELAITDSAALLGTVSLPEPQAGPAIGFIPHFEALPHVPWPAICRRLGLRYINPRAPVVPTLAAIRGCSCLITEAMHGAIVADVCRVPWVPVVTGNHVLHFKWHDWMESMEIDFPLRRIASLARVTTHRSGDHPLVALGRRSLNAVALGVRLLPLTRQLHQLRRQLERRQLQPCLSREAVLRDRIDRLRHQLDRLRADRDSAR